MGDNSSSNTRVPDADSKSFTSMLCQLCNIKFDLTGAAMARNLISNLLQRSHSVMSAFDANRLIMGTRGYMEWKQSPKVTVTMQQTGQTREEINAFRQHLGQAVETMRQYEEFISVAKASLEKQLDRVDQFCAADDKIHDDAAMARYIQRHRINCSNKYYGVVRELGKSHGVERPPMSPVVQGASSHTGAPRKRWSPPRADWNTEDRKENDGDASMQEDENEKPSHLMALKLWRECVDLETTVDSTMQHGWQWLSTIETHLLNKQSFERLEKNINTDFEHPSQFTPIGAVPENRVISADVRGQLNSLERTLAQAQWSYEKLRDQAAAKMSTPIPRAATRQLVYTFPNAIVGKS